MVIELKIDPEFKKIIAPPTQDERIKLEKSLEEGYDDAFPIIVWNNTIVDGHNRYEFCLKHNIEPKVQKKDFKSRDEALIWIIDRQIQRRNISKKYWEFLVGERLRISTRTIAGRPKLVQNEPNTVDESENKTIEEFADEIGVSRSTAKRLKAKDSDLTEIANNIGVTARDIVDNSKNTNVVKELKQFDGKKQKEIYKKAVKEKKNIEDVIKEVKPPEPVKEPERNEDGALIVTPEKVTMRVVQVTPESISAIESLPGERALKCDIDVDDKRESCYISLPKHRNNFLYEFPYYKEVLMNFHFELPNIENLILDLRNIFPSMTPIVSYLPTEGKYIYFNHSFSVEQWNNFVKERCPQMIIQEEPEKQEEPDKPKEEPEEPAKSKQKKEPEEPNPKEEPKKAKELKPESEEPKRDYTKDKEIIRQLIPTIDKNGISVQELIDKTGRREDYDNADEKGIHAIEGTYQRFMKSQGFVSKKVGKGYRYVKVESDSAGVRRKTTSTRR